MTVSTYLEGEIEEVFDVSLGVPIILCKDGIDHIVPISMEYPEKKDFYDTALCVKENTDKIRNMLNNS